MTEGVWSSGMIPASGAGGPEFDSPNSPESSFFLLFCFLFFCFLTPVSAVFSSLINPHRKKLFCYFVIFVHNKSRAFFVLVSRWFSLIDDHVFRFSEFFSFSPFLCFFLFSFFFFFSFFLFFFFSFFFFLSSI